MMTADGPPLPEWDHRNERLYLLALESIEPSGRTMQRDVYGALADATATTLDRLTPVVWDG